MRVRAPLVQAKVRERTGNGVFEHEVFTNCTGPGLLRCAECGSNYVVKSRSYYGCAASINRGRTICSNTKLVERGRLERIVLGAIFDRVFAPETLEFLNRKVNEAIVTMSAPADMAREKQQSELEQARPELENIKTFIRLGNATPTKGEMLRETEERIALLESALRPGSSQRKIVYLPGVVEACLRDLKGTLDMDKD